MVDINRDRELRDAIEMLYFGYRSFTLGPDRILERLGLNRVHHRILYFVGRNPGLSVNDLLSILQVRKQALNAPLRQLQEMELVNSQQSSRDGRVRELSLTARGEELEAQLSNTQIEHLQRVFLAAGRDAEAGWRKAMALMLDPSA
ncbi:MAG: MarR family transcriptional regulator [Pseudomonadota bacterium]